MPWKAYTSFFATIRKLVPSASEIKELKHGTRHCLGDDVNVDLLPSIIFDVFDKDNRRKPIRISASYYIDNENCLNVVGYESNELIIGTTLLDAVYSTKRSVEKRHASITFFFNESSNQSGKILQKYAEPYPKSGEDEFDVPVNRIDPKNLYISVRYVHLLSKKGTMKLLITEMPMLLDDKNEHDQIGKFQ